jgi:hypothetical protein
MYRNCLKQGVGSAAQFICLLGFLATSASLMATPGPAVALAWDPSTDPTVMGYNVYYGTASRAYTNVVAAGSSTSAVVSNLAIGMTYYFAATTYTVAGLESDYSAEASYMVPVPNVPPTLDALTNLTISQDARMQVVSLTGITSGSTNEIQTLTVSAFSSNPGLIPNPVVDYSSPDTNGTLTFSPALGSFGSAIITVMVDDGAVVSNTVIRSFTVTVNPIDNPPTIDLLSDLVINENSGAQTVNLTGITSGSTNANLTLTVAASSSNPALISNPTVSYTSPSAVGTLSFTPVTNAYGSAKITVTVNDNQPTNNSTSISFNVTVNQTATAPGLLTSVSIAPNTFFRLLITPPVTNGDKFSISLAAGAPAGVRLSSRKGASWLIWTPTAAQASTTNLIGINIIDTMNSAFSTNEIVQVIVQDSIALVVGSASIQAGQSGTVPFMLSSSDGVTNLSFTMPWPTNSLINPTLSTSVAGIASSSLKNQSTNLLVTLQMLPGQSLQGSNVIGSVNFQSLAMLPSSYINLPVSTLTAYKPTSVAYANAVTTAGQVAVVNNLAILQAGASAGPARSLTILGKVGNNYQVQYCTNFGPGAVWYPVMTYSQTSITQSVSLDPTIVQAFYRVQQK